MLSPMDMPDLSMEQCTSEIPSYKHQGHTDKAFVVLNMLRK